MVLEMPYRTNSMTSLIGNKVHLFDADALAKEDAQSPFNGTSVFVYDSFFLFVFFGRI